MPNRIPGEKYIEALITDKLCDALNEYKEKEINNPDNLGKRITIKDIVINAIREYINYGGE